MRAVTRTTILSYPSRTCCSVLEKCQSRSERDRVLNTGLGGLTTPLNIQLKKTATTLPLLEVEIGVVILTTAAASTPEATARLLSSKMGSSAPSALYRLWWQAQKLGTTLETPLADSHTDRWRLLRCSILHEKTKDSISDPPPLSDTLLSSTHDTQTCLKNIEPHHLDWGE